MKTMVMLSMALALSGCASGLAQKQAIPPNQEIQCEAPGFHTLASEIPDYLSTLRSASL